MDDEEARHECFYRLLSLENGVLSTVDCTTVIFIFHPNKVLHLYMQKLRQNNRVFRAIIRVKTVNSRIVSQKVHSQMERMRVRFTATKEIWGLADCEFTVLEIHWLAIG